MYTHVESNYMPARVVYIKNMGAYLTHEFKQQMSLPTRKLTRAWMFQLHALCIVGMFNYDQYKISAKG